MASLPESRRFIAADVLVVFVDLLLKTLTGVSNVLQER